MRSHPAIGESIYFLDRLQHLAAGELPYKQFEFAYGPFLLYLPLATAYLFRLSLADGYYISWIAEFALGILLIYGCVSLLPAQPTRKNIMFLLLTFSWWAGPLSFGENYTPFRFFLPPFLCLLACRRISSSIAATRTALELLVGEAVILLVSPELAVAFGGATILYVLLRYLSSRAARHLRVLGLFVLGSAPLFWGAAETGPSADSSLHEPWWIQLSPPARHAAHPRDRPSTRSFLRLRQHTPNPALLRARRVPHPARPLHASGRLRPIRHRSFHHRQHWHANGCLDHSVVLPTPLAVCRVVLRSPSALPPSTPNPL